MHYPFKVKPRESCLTQLYVFSGGSHNEDYRPNGKDPVDIKKSDSHCVRGGSREDYDLGDFRCADRYCTGRNNWGNMIGFRLSAGQK
jgi:hypothetical protein